MLDVLLDWAAVGLPTILGIVAGLMALNPPPTKHHKLWFSGAFVVGIAISGITFWQQYRARSAHASETINLNSHLGELQVKIDLQDKQLANQNLQIVEQTKRIIDLNGIVQAESARRQQSEKDMELLTIGVGNRTTAMTRKGVSEDFRASPIQVMINGQPSRDPNQMRAVRDSLAIFLESGVSLRNRCYTNEDIAVISKDADLWFNSAGSYIKENLGSSFLVQFQNTRLSAISPANMSEDRKALWFGINQRVETLDKFIDELKQ